MSRAQIIIAACVAGLGLTGILFVWWFSTTPTPPAPTVISPTASTSTPLEVPSVATSSSAIIGESVQGRPITAHSFGTGDTDILFVGGIHGGYEWNSIVLAYDMIDQLHATPEVIPPALTIHIIPNLNPDGLAIATDLEGRIRVADIPNTDMHQTGLGRFNANNVDLNRNFDCKWQPESTWRGRLVSAGTGPFSEPEAIALRDYVLTTQPVAVAFWHSQANTVYASECESGVLPETIALMNTYASAANYNAVASFDAYPVSGDAEGWLASIGIPAITVELEGRLTPEWERNWAGVLAILDRYSTE